MLAQRRNVLWAVIHVASLEATLRLALLSLLAFVPGGVSAAGVEKYGVFEASFEAEGEYENPYRDLAPTATFARPDGQQWTIPFFWDGDNRWKVRVSPDLPGNWSYTIHSSDAGLRGKSGQFECTQSSHRGGILPMQGSPYHFQYQDGTPMWFFGDTAWRAFSEDPSEHLARVTVQRYVDVRAEQGFNYIHTDLTGTGGINAGFNEGGPMFFDIRDEDLNPTYFREVERRIRYINEKGITSGIVLAWGRGFPSWQSFRSDEARRRYARYVTARYSAFNVTFIISGEWGYMPERRDLWTKLGNEIADADPHDRMIGIHPGGSRESRTSGQFADEEWCAFGDYQQYYGAPTDRPATDAERDDMRSVVLRSRKRQKPVVHSEYAYFLRDRDGDGKVDKQHSHSRTTFRRASWVIAMAGGYFVTGFGTTYFGGWRDPGRFYVDDPRNDPAEEDLLRIRDFFTALDWWKLDVQDSLVSGNQGGYRYCLADIGNTYVIYTSGTRKTRLDLGTASGASYAIKRYDPRTGKYSDAEHHTGKGPLSLDAPDSRDWVFLVRREP